MAFGFPDSRGGRRNCQQPLVLNSPSFFLFFDGNSPSLGPLMLLSTGGKRFGLTGLPRCGLGYGSTATLSLISKENRLKKKYLKIKEK
jgi:hypothetical protein